jgi:hypothetical protein
MLAMPVRAKVFAQSRRAAAMPTFARLFTRETPRRCVQKRRNDGAAAAAPPPDTTPELDEPPDDKNLMPCWSSLTVSQSEYG